MNPNTYPPLKRTALWLAIGWSIVLAIVYLSLSPISVALLVEHGDKYAHIAAYAVLMLWFTQIYSGSRNRIAIAFSLAAMGIGIEILQGFTSYRMFEWADIVADFAGVAIGWLMGPPRTPNVLSGVEKVL